MMYIETIVLDDMGFTGASQVPRRRRVPRRSWSDVMTRSPNFTSVLERMSSKGERQIVFVTGEPGIGKPPWPTHSSIGQQTRRLTSSPRGMHRGLWEQGSCGIGLLGASV